MQQRWGSISYSNHLQLDVFLPLLLMFMFIEILFGFCKRNKTLKIMKYTDGKYINDYSEEKLTFFPI